MPITIRSASLFAISALASLASARQMTITFSIIEDLTPKPVAYTDFSLTSPNGATTVYRTDASGTLSLDLAPGRYRLKSAKETAFKGKAYLWDRDLDVPAGAEPQRIVLTDADAKVSTGNPARVVSDEARIYRNVKNAVVTVQCDGGKGSGFLVSEDGLIVTNQHVVADTNSIAVKLGPGQRYSASLVFADPASDVAVIRVNPEIARKMAVLRLAVPVDGAIAVEGEKVVAIGSPLDQDKVMTVGIVSKVEKDVLISDVNINHGNSGGPVLNLEGDVIGMATFLDAKAPNGPGISGVVSVEKVRPVLQKAREAVPSVEAPPTTALPDVAEFKVPDSMLDEAALKGKDRTWRLKAPRTFLTIVRTPFDLAYQQATYEREMSKRANRRDNKKGKAEVPPRRFWERYAGSSNDAVVTILVLPMPQESSSSQWRRGLFGSVIGGKAQMEYRYDFHEMRLLRDGKPVEPVQRNRVRKDELFYGIDLEMKDRAYAGFYTYDPEVFAPGAKIELQVRKTTDAAKWDSVELSKSEVAKIYSEFAGYRDAAKAVGR